jgi:hypothetical protein
MSRRRRPMSHCYVCGTTESWDRGQGTPEGWLCSGCRNVGPINNNLGNAQGTFSNEFPGVELMGVFGTMAFSGPQKTAIKRIVNSSPVHAEDIWGVGVAAEHVTTPGTNIAVVFTRPHGGGTFRLLGIGRHTGKDNNQYRIMCWHGGTRRVQRT